MIIIGCPFRPSTNIILQPVVCPVMHLLGCSPSQPFSLIIFFVVVQRNSFHLQPVSALNMSHHLCTHHPWFLLLLLSLIFLTLYGYVLKKFEYLVIDIFQIRYSLAVWGLLSYWPSFFTVNHRIILFYSKLLSHGLLNRTSKWYIFLQLMILFVSLIHVSVVIFLHWNSIILLSV